MPELTRADLNLYLPDDLLLRRRAERIVGFVFGSDDHMVVRGLEWLFDKTESERFPTVPWIAVHPYEHAVSVEFRGLWCKPSWGYMTNHGWGLGERCWFSEIECGLKILITGEFPALVIARSIVVMDLCVEWRDTEPPLRARRITDMIDTKMETGTWEDFVR